MFLDTLTDGDELIPKLNTTRIGMVLVLVPIAFEVVFILVLAGVLVSQEQTLDALSHSRDAILALQKTATALQRTIATVSCSTELTEQSRKEINEAFAVVNHPKKFDKYVNMYPEVKSIFDESENHNEDIMKFVTALKKVADDKTLTEPQRLFRLGNTFSNNQALLLKMCFDASTTMKRIPAIESRIRAAQPEELNRFHWQLGILLGGGLALSAAITIVLANIFTNDLIKRLHRIGANAHLLASGKALPKPGNAVDEFTQLEKVLYDSSLVLMESRSRELAIIDYAADVLCSLDNRLRIETVSASSIKAWKYSPDELLGMSILSLLSNDTVEDTRLAFQQIAEDMQESRIENLIRCKDRELKDSLWTVNWSAQDNKYFCVVHDVTELRTIERLKQHFLSMVSHDLRTPLSSVAVSFQLLADGKRGALSPRALEELSKCRLRLDSLTRLVNELLELEKLEAGMVKIETDYVSASELCIVAGDAVQDLASLNGVSIDQPSSDSVIIGDESRLIKVLSTLLSCAISVSPHEGTVKVSLRREGKFVEIRVIDQGPGMSQDDCELFFDKLGQTMLGNKNSVYKQFGLGLVIVKEIVSAHGGECGVTSEIGKGSEFWIRIPEFVADEAEDEI